MKKRINIYLAGKVKTNYTDRNGGWRYDLIIELFGVEIPIGQYDSDFNWENTPISPIINGKDLILNYVGPYLYGCDHGCSHSFDYAHGILTCCNLPKEQNTPDARVLTMSLKQIDISDVIIVNFNVAPLEMYGAIAEIGYAHGKNKMIFGLGKPERELWFVQGMCEMCDSVEALRIKLHAYIRSISTVSFN